MLAGSLPAPLRQIAALTAVGDGGWVLVPADAGMPLAWIAALLGWPRRRVVETRRGAPSPLTPVLDGLPSSPSRTRPSRAVGHDSCPCPRRRSSSWPVACQACRSPCAADDRPGRRVVDVSQFAQPPLRPRGECRSGAAASRGCGPSWRGRRTSGCRATLTWPKRPLTIESAAADARFTPRTRSRGPRRHVGSR